jgi:hypothetical protein
MSGGDNMPDVDYVSLLRELGIRGRVAGNKHYSRCPMHQGQRLSLYVNIRSGMWECYRGCGPEHWQERTFHRLVMLVLDLTSTAAELWLRQRGRDKDNGQLHDRIEELLAPAAFKMTWDSYYNQLDAKIMPVQFLQRGFTWETIAEWGIRWDNFSERVIIPVHDVKGAMVGWVGRAMRPDSQPKYLNSPGLQRNQLLFGVARPQLAHGTILLTEGPLDAIWLQQNGYPGVAVFGTSLSEQQMALVRRFHTIIIGYDNDGPGRDATAKIWRQMIDAGYLMHQLWLMRYPDGKDANECTPIELTQAWYTRAQMQWPTGEMTWQV